MGYDCVDTNEKLDKHIKKVEALARKHFKARQKKIKKDGK